MPPGGKRIGAGRKLGAATKRTREIPDMAAATGKLPLEVMLDNMRHFAKLAESAEAALAELSADEIAGLPAEEQFKYLLAKVKKATGLREWRRLAREMPPRTFIRSCPRTAITFAEKRDHFDWTREELVAIINEPPARKELLKRMSATESLHKVH
jgi:hypothetical protein